MKKRHYFFVITQLVIIATAIIFLLTQFNGLKPLKPARKNGLLINKVAFKDKSNEYAYENQQIERILYPEKFLDSKFNEMYLHTNANASEGLFVVISKYTMLHSAADAKTKQARLKLQPETVIQVDGKLIESKERWEYDYYALQYDDNTRFIPFQYLVRPSKFRSDVELPIGDFTINDDNPLPYTYKPSDLKEVSNSLKAVGYTSKRIQLRQEALEAFYKLFDYANANHYELGFASCYVSPDEQDELYENAMRTQSPKQSSTAKPTTSEKQLGTACDISSQSNDWKINQQFENTPDFRWLKTYAHCFGIKFTHHNGNEMGLEYKPWRLRFVNIIPEDDENCKTLNEQD